MLRRRPSRLFRRFRRADKGLAAVEFALILPVMITMLFGMGELSLAVFCRSDISQIASTVADLVAQESAISSTDLQNVYNAANIILYPYYQGASSQVPTIRITSVVYDSTAGDPTKMGKVAWSCTQSGTATLTVASRAVGSRVTFDQPLLTSGGSVLMTEVAYNYASPTTQVITGTLVMRDNFYTKPRRVAQIPAPSPAPSSCAT